jgi:membrane protease YdiL (CAAX protease family)
MTARAVTPAHAALADTQATLPADRRRILPWVQSAGLLVGLAAIVGLRWLAVTSGMPGLGVGLGFGVALTALWVAADREQGRSREGRTRPEASRIAAGRAGPRLGRLAVGAVFGLVLVLATVAGPSIAGAVVPVGVLRPAAPFLPWALVTIVVATAEEGILRGALFDRLRVAAGLPIAIGVSTVAFALMHVPLYGWGVVPLDLAVGLGLAGLRITTGSIVAPAAAHAVADLATWWL